MIESVADANIGSIMGIGFPAWSGGVLQFINGLRRGPCRLRRPARGSSPKATASASRPPASLVEKAERGEVYTDDEVLVGA